MTSEFPPSEVKREKSWEDMREEMKNAASFKSKQTVKSGGTDICLFYALAFISSSRKENLRNLHLRKCLECVEWVEAKGHLRSTEVIVLLSVIFLKVKLG